MGFRVQKTVRLRVQGLGFNGLGFRVLGGAKMTIELRV